eukprot:1006761-Prorocentrum_lima.AAC.1
MDPTQWQRQPGQQDQAQSGHKKHHGGQEQGPPQQGAHFHQGMQVQGGMAVEQVPQAARREQASSYQVSNTGRHRDGAPVRAMKDGD